MVYIHTFCRYMCTYYSSTSYFRSEFFMIIKGFKLSVFRHIQIYPSMSIYFPHFFFLQQNFVVIQEYPLKAKEKAKALFISQKSPSVVIFHLCWLVPALVYVKQMVHGVDHLPVVQVWQNSGFQSLGYILFKKKKPSRFKG